MTNDTPGSTDRSPSEAPKDPEDRTLVRQMVEEIRRLTETAGGPLPAWIEALERIVAVETVASGIPGAPGVRALETPVSLTQALATPCEKPMPVGPHDGRCVPSTSMAFPVVDSFDGFAAPTEVRPLSNVEELAREHFQRGEEHRRQRDYESTLVAYNQALWYAPQSVPILLERGRVLLLTGTADGAVADFDEVLRLDPNHAEAFLWRGNAHTDLCRWQEAIADFTAAIERAPEDTAALLNRGLVYARLQDYSRVLEDARAALRITPHLPGAHFLRGLASSHTQPHAPAGASSDRAASPGLGTADPPCDPLTAALPSDPLSNSCGCDLSLWAAMFRPSSPPRRAAELASPTPSFGQASSRPGRDRRVTQLAPAPPTEETEEYALESDEAPAPTEPASSHKNPGMTQVETTDDSEAVDLGAVQPESTETFVLRRSPPTMLDFSLSDREGETVSSKPVEAPPPAAKSLPANADDLARKYFQKGESYRSRGDLRRALGCYTEALRLHPHWVPALMERGQIYRQARRPELAIIDFNVALEIEPTHVEIYLRRGNALLDQGRIDDALNDFTTAIQLDPEHAEAYTTRARAHFRNKDNGKVIEDASEAIRLDPELASAYLLRGTAYSNRNDHPEAIADLDRAVQCEPRNALAYNERGLAHARKGDYPQAIANYSKALGLAPKLAIARFNRGLANRLAGNYPLAVADFTEFSTRQPETPEAYFHRALAHRGQGDFLYALADFDRALALKPDYVEAQQYRSETEQEAIKSGVRVNGNTENEAEETALAEPAKPMPAVVSSPRVPRSTPQTGAGDSPTTPGSSRRPIANPFLRKRSDASKASPQEPPTRPTDGRYRRLVWMSAAVLGAILLVFAGAALVGSMSIASAMGDDSRFSTEQLSEQGAADKVKGKEIEVSGLAESIDSGDGSPPSVTLIGAKGSGKVVCTVNPVATSTRTMFPNIEKGKYVVIKGRCEGVDGDSVKLVDARIAFVMNTPKKRVKK